jgi:hypothetical protein
MMSVLNRFISFIVFVILIFLFSIENNAQKIDNSSELVKLYKEYRIVQLKKNNWVDTIDNWTSKFHMIMSKLGDTLGKPIYTKQDISSLLGKPDEIINRSTRKNTGELYYLINNKPVNEIKKKEEYLIYKWRGYHDFLYFYIKNNIVQCSEWYYSWE